MATDVLQLVFVGTSGFTFPFAFFPVSTLDVSSMYHILWKAVFHLLQRGFYVRAFVCDGAQSNRSFIKAHFSEQTPEESLFKTANIYTGEPMFFIVDPSVS